MNCQKLEEVVTEIARDTSLDLLDPAVRENVLSHLAACGECEQRLQDELALTRRLHEMATQMRSLTAPKHLEAQVVKNYREMITPLSRSSATAPTLRWKRAALVAAVVLIATIVGLRWYLMRPTPQPVGGPDQVAKDVQPEPQLVAATVQKTLNNRASTTVERVRPRKRVRTNSSAGNSKREVPPVPVTNDIEREVATHFMPIGFAGPINPQDGGELVRVELSRSAMLSLGLPVNMDRFGESVKADVLLGPDGLARAIRFVR